MQILDHSQKCENLLLTLGWCPLAFAFASTFAAFAAAVLS